MRTPMRVLAILAMLAITGSAYGAEPIELATFVRLPRPAPTAVLPYGTAAAQAVDLFLPNERGPHPVAILIHGGCWRNLPGAGREQLRHLGAELARQGVAVWSIGYRRADEEGGGYPGTFRDVAVAIDRLRSEAPQHSLDLARTVLVGHSAGGHLALWAAVRHRLPEASPLRGDADPFMPRSVISLAGVGDLEAFARFVPVLCGPGILDNLTRGEPGYADISPAALAAPDIPIVMISGILDRLVPPYVAYDYARAVRRKEARAAVELVDIPNAGHF